MGFDNGCVYDNAQLNQVSVSRSYLKQISKSLGLWLNWALRQGLCGICTRVSSLSFAFRAQTVATEIFAMIREKSMSYNIYYLVKNIAQGEMELKLRGLTSDTF